MKKTTCQKPRVSTHTQAFAVGNGSARRKLRKRSDRTDPYRKKGLMKHAWNRVVEQFDFNGVEEENLNSTIGCQWMGGTSTTAVIWHRRRMRICAL